MQGKFANTCSVGLLQRLIASVLFSLRMDRRFTMHCKQNLLNTVFGKVNCKAAWLLSFVFKLGTRDGGTDMSVSFC